MIDAVFRIQICWIGNQIIIQFSDCLAIVILELERRCLRQICNCR